MFTYNENINYSTSLKYIKQKLTAQLCPALSRPTTLHKMIKVHSISWRVNSTIAG